MVFNKCIYKIRKFFLGGKHVWKSKSNNKSWVMNGKKPFGNLIVLPNGSFIPTANSTSANQLGILGLLFHAEYQKVTPPGT